MEVTTKQALRLIPLILIFCCSIHELIAQNIKPVLSTRRTLPVNWYGWNLAATTRGGSSCLNPNLIEKTQVLKAKTLRFPAGDFGNWYDWKTGWYKDTVLLPEKYWSQTKVPNRLEDFKVVLDSTSADAVLLLNMLTASLQDQIAMLKHADSIGIAIKYVELGNEFYLDGSEDTTLILALYPTVEDYGNVAKIWIDTIHHYFPNAQVAVQGNFDKNTAPRRVTWNDGILATVDNEDVWTFHYYYNSNFYDPEETEAEKLDVTMNDVPIWLYQPFAAWKILSEVSLPRMPAGRTAWVTEYNLADKERPTHGMWAHGMFQALQTMLLLHDERVVISHPHAICGTAVYGAFFFTNDGFDFGSEGNFIPPPVQPPTTLWGKTATGYTMTTLSEAIDQMQYASPLLFEGDTQVIAYDRNKDETNYYDALYGWLFNNEEESRAVIMNVGGTEQLITTTDLFPNGGTYTILQAPVLSLIATAADMTITNGTFGSDLTLPPYSMVKILSSSIPGPPPPKAEIVASGSTTLCSGDSVQLDAGAGYHHYVWSTGETTQRIWAKAEGKYSVYAYPEVFGYCGADTVFVKVNQRPQAPNIVVDGDKKFCDGGSVHIELGPAYDPTGLNFYWPLTGETTTGIDATINGGHYLILTDSNGCTAHSDTEMVTVYLLPQPAITSVGPTSACYDMNVTLEVTSTFNGYSWLGGGVQQSKTFLTSGTYNCTVTDSNGCKNTSNSIEVTIWEPPLPLITASGPSTFCIEDAVYLTTIPDYKYQWIKGATILTGATDQTYYPNNTGSYKVEITDVHGCQKKSTGLDVTVKSLNPPSISSSSSTAICDGSSVNLSVPPTYALYVWSNGGTTNMITVSDAGDYTCTLMDQDGCVGTTLPKTVTVNPLPQPYVTALGATEFCEGGSVDLKAANGYSQYNWSNGKGGQTITSNVSETVTVTVKDGNNCFGTSDPITVTEWLVPAPTVTASGPLTFCADDPTVLTTIPGYSYQWLRSGIPITGATNQSYTPTQGGAHKVIITDSHGCSENSSNVSISINTAPTPTISGNLGICAGSSTILSASAGYDSYLWSTGQTTQSISLSNAGSFNVTGTDINGCKATSITKNTTINPVPNPVITALGSTSFCDGGSVELDAGNFNSYLWSNGKTTKTVSITSSGNYSVTVTNGSGCSGTSGAVPVNEWTIPSPSITSSSGSSIFCINSGTYLTTLPGYSYQWLKGGVNINGATNQNFYPTTTGSANYKVKLTDTHGCSKTSSNFNYTVNPAPAPVVTGNSVICEGSSVTLSAGTYDSYTWSTGSNASSINVTSAGSYSVTVTDANGCTGNSPVKNLTVSPTPSPTIEASGPISFCDGGSVILDAGSGYSNYTWSNGKTTPTITVSSSGTFSVTVKNSGSCSGTSSPVTVNEWIVPNPVVTPVGITTFCSGLGTYVTTIGGYNYQWLKGTKNVSGATNQIHYPTATGIYKVKITDTHGCSKTSNIGVSITVLNSPSATISTSGSTNICSGQTKTLTANSGSGLLYQWKKNGNSINGATAISYLASTAGDFQCLVTNASLCSTLSNTITLTSDCKDGSSDSEPKVSWQVYPNPASDLLHIRLSQTDWESGNCGVEVRNMVGTQLLATEQGFINYNISADINLDPSLPGGVYFVIVRIHDRIYRSEFVITK